MYSAMYKKARGFYDGALINQSKSIVIMQSDSSRSSMIPIEQPLPVEGITYMDSDLFKAAEDGDLELFNKYQGGLHCLVDGRQNTALHIYSRTGGRQVVKTDQRFLRFPKRRFEREFSINFVEQLVDKCPSLLLQPNDKGEIPLHIAVRHGHSEIVKFLIERSKVVLHEDLEKGTSGATSSRLRQMLRMRNKEENSAFHTAVGSGNVDVVRLLVKELDPDFSFSANKSGETPLYIAAKRSGNHLVVAEILDNCMSVDYGGPYGKTALHVAVTVRRNEMTVRKLVEAKKQLTKETDDKGRTPLHYAAYSGKYWAAKVLLETDASAAYITDKDRGMSVLHMAAWQGKTRIMEEIISHCPGCCEIVDNRGWNFLHIAFVTLPAERIRRCLLDYKNKIKDLPIRNLLEEKDVNGNTPLHVLIFGTATANKDSVYFEVLDILLSFASDISLYDIYSDSVTKKIQIQKVLKDIANYAEVTGIPFNLPFHMYVKEEEKEKGEEDIPQHLMKEKTREAHLLVATLVATVTFAAAFTVPGGYKSEQGTAALSHDLAFKTFIITDTLAFVSSLFAIFIHFRSVMVNKRYFFHILSYWFLVADCLTFFAMMAMVVAFSTGTYAVLKSSLGFAIAICSLGVIFFPGLLFLLFFYFSIFNVI